jgi:hypothetical protein
VKEDTSRSFEERDRFVDYHGRAMESKLQEESQERKLRNDFLILITLNSRLKALYRNKDANYVEIMDFKYEAFVTVLEIYLEKESIKKLNIVKEIKNNTKSAYGGE